MAIKEKEIDGVRFAVAPFQVTEALRIKSYLIRTFGPSLGHILGALKGVPLGSKDIGDVPIVGLDISQAIENLMGHLGEDEFVALIKRMFRNVTAYITKDGKSLQLSFAEQAFDTSMNIVFEGRVFSVYSVIVLVLEANYPDFFVLMAQGIGSRIQKIITSELDEQSSKSEQEE